MVALRTVPNEARCDFTDITHILPIQNFCPVSHNPAGGEIEISYTPDGCILEVASLRTYVDSYKGGKGEIRSMEGCIQAIAQDCADTVGVYVIITTTLDIHPGQRMKLKCTTFPNNAELRKATQ